MIHGKRVQIIEDCREGGAATGQFGVYEGSHPYSVGVCWGGEFFEYEITELETVRASLPHFNDVADAIERYEEENPSPKYPADNTDEATEEWEQALVEWRKASGLNYYWERTNSRIRLDDGSIIWGIECWWRPAEIEETLEEARRRVEKAKGYYRQVLFGDEEE